MKKKLALLSVALLATSITSLVGCGQKDNYDPNNFLETGDKIVKEKVTIKLFVPKHSLHSNWNDMKLFKKMEERTNIHIEFIEAPLASYSSLSAATWAGNDLPDGFFTYNKVEDVASHGRDGIIYDLSEYLDKYAPNYTKIMNAHPEWKARTLIEGKIYSPAIITDVPRDLTFKQFLNKTWIQNVNDIYKYDYEYPDDQLLSLNPSTLEEYTKILYAFKNEDANMNGNANDEVPLSSVGLGQTRNFILSALGHVSTSFEIGSDGRVTHCQLSDAYRRYLEYAHQLYADGVLDQKVFEKTSSDDLAIKGYLNGSFDGAAAYLVTGTKYDKDYIAVQPLTSDINNKKMWLKFNTYCEPTCIQIPKKSKYVRELVRWIDVFYSEEGSQLASFGEEGVDWQWNDAAKTSFHFNVPQGKTIEEFRGTLTCAPGTGIPYWYKDFVLKEDGEYTSRINQQVEAAGYEKSLVEPMPYVVLSKADQRAISIDLVEISNVCAVFEAKVIKGVVELNDTTWQNQINLLYKYNLQKCIDIYNKYI